ncbi:MAG: hypothetical protein IJT82_09530 [Schwartzia sp.]|nr:hypothetical protein [Schwartzia sp. (in: firmicutes)]
MGSMDIIGSAASASAVIAALFGAVAYIANATIAPLKISIDCLAAECSELRNSIAAMETELRRLSVRLASLGERSDAQESRLGVIERSVINHAV